MSNPVVDDSDSTGSDIPFAPPPLAPPPPPPPQQLLAPPAPGSMFRSNELVAAADPPWLEPTIPDKNFYNKRKRHHKTLKELDLDFAVKVTVNLEIKSTVTEKSSLIFSVVQIKDFDLLRKIITSNFSRMLLENKRLRTWFLIDSISMSYTNDNQMRDTFAKGIVDTEFYNAHITGLRKRYSVFTPDCYCGDCEGEQPDIPEILILIKLDSSRQQHFQSLVKRNALKFSQLDETFKINFDELEAESGPGSQLEDHGKPGRPRLAIDADALKQMIRSKGDLGVAQEAIEAKDAQIAQLHAQIVKGQEAKKRSMEENRALQVENSELKARLAALSLGQSAATPAVPEKRKSDEATLEQTSPPLAKRTKQTYAEILEEASIDADDVREFAYGRPRRNRAGRS